jgi:hypothetical protein
MKMPALESLLQRTPSSYAFNACAVSRLGLLGNKLATLSSFTLVQTIHQQLRTVQALYNLE